MPPRIIWDGDPGRLIGIAVRPASQRSGREYNLRRSEAEELLAQPFLIDFRQRIGPQGMGDLLSHAGDAPQDQEHIS